MAKLIVTMGISGSGKSRYASEYDEKGSDFTRVNMDTLRKIWTGDISDQSKNHQVADTCFAIVEYLLHMDKDVIWDATSTNSGTRNKLLKIAKDQGAETKLVVMMDSKDFALCQARVNKDLENGVDRAKTTIDDSIMMRQYSGFMDALKAIDKEGWGQIEKLGGK
jgi:predicted kinase